MNSVLHYDALLIVREKLWKRKLVHDHRSLSCWCEGSPFIGELFLFFSYQRQKGQQLYHIRKHMSQSQQLQPQTET